MYHIKRFYDLSLFHRDCEPLAEGFQFSDCLQEAYDKLRLKRNLCAIPGMPLPNDGGLDCSGDAETFEGLFCLRQATLQHNF